MGGSNGISTIEEEGVLTTVWFADDNDGPHSASNAAAGVNRIVEIPANSIP